MLKCAATASAITGLVIYIQLQLPYLEDGNRKIVQSNAIMRYIARKHNMCKWKVCLFFCLFIINGINPPHLLSFSLSDLFFVVLVS